MPGGGGAGSGHAIVGRAQMLRPEASFPSPMLLGEKDTCKCASALVPGSRLFTEADRDQACGFEIALLLCPCRAALSP